MNPDQAQEQRLLEAVLALATEPERQAFLAAIADPVARRRLEEMLAASAEAEDFFGAPPAVNAGLDPTPPTMPLPAPVQPPAPSLGRYKLLEKIGEGGFGEVWMAEQREPVKRRVALKIIKLGMDSRQIVARFEAERQALAMMDHANIARIFDADVTDTGRPYFVMELVRGIKITDYCDQNQLSTGERLALFTQVCQAIQHAHQKGIIHRDIKPSNILVTLHDGVPVPKVIDFGIAKATQQELTDKTVFTQFQQFIGTPAYISPEQAEMSGLDIDTRADIYSLGVLLYELLVGQTPFDAKEMMQGGLDALRRIIREREPLRPSTKLNTLYGDARATAAKRRQTDAGKLVHQLQGDLDWIVMKCLEKDRTRRYDTANGLATDIQRYLANEPVVARPPSVGYKIQKAWQRNRLAFTAAAAVALALIVGSGLSTWQAIEATRARKAETHQRVAAENAQAAAVAKQQEAEASRAGEAAQRRRAEARTYAGDMNLAQQALQADNLELARELLDRHRPKPGQPDPRGWEWRYLWQQSRSAALDTLCRQPGRIAGLDLSHDGQWLAIRTSSGSVSVWNLPSRREVMQAPGNWNAVAFSPTRPLLAMWNTAPPGTQGWLHFWDAATGKFVSGAPPADPAGGAVKRGLAFLPDGQSLLAHTRNELSLWRASDGRQLAAYPIAISGFGIGFPSSLARETNLLAVAGEDLRLRVIDLTSGQDVFTADAPGNGWLESAALSADGRLLATSAGTSETAVRLWDVARGRPMGTLEGHRAYVSALVFWPDGKTLATASADRTVRIWDVENRRSLAVLHGHLDEVHRLALHPDQSTLISGGRDGAVMIWTNVTVARRQAATLAWKTGPHRMFRSLWSISGTGDELLTIERDGWLKRWHGLEFDQSELLFAIDPTPKDARFSGDHRWLATQDDDGSVKIWHVGQRKRVHTLSSPEGGLNVCRFLADNTRLAVWNKEARTLALHDVVTGNRVGSWSHPELGAVRPVISADGRWCVTRENGGGHLRDLSTGRALGELPLSGRQEATFSPDGSLLSIHYGSGTVRLWELPSLREREPLSDILAKVVWIAFSPNERRLVMESDANESLKLWDVESSRPMLTLSGDTDSSRAIGTTFSADGSTIVVLHGLGTFDIWRAPSWEQIAAAEAKEKAESRP